MHFNTKREHYFTVPSSLAEARLESGLLDNEYKQVVTAFSFVMSSNDDVKSVSVHRGFLTNGKSTPLIPRLLIKKWLGEECISLVLNDWLSEYLLIESRYKNEQTNIYGALNIFINALKTEGLNKKQLFIIKTLCLISIFWKNPHSNKINPYKRYLEDMSFWCCD